MISFANFPLGVSSLSTNQQLSAIFRNDKIITANYTRFLRSLCGMNLPLNLITAKPDTILEPKKIRILLMAPAVTPSLTISFIKPFSLMPHLIEYQLIHETGNDVLGREPGPKANAKRCKQILDDYQPDVLVLCRYANKDAIQLSVLCKERNIKVIYYMDDLLFDPSPDVLDSNKYYNYKKRAPVILDLISKSDSLYCSTPALKKELLTITKHSNIYAGSICLSADIDSLNFNNNRKRSIGYTGFGHTQDLQRREDVLIEILHEYPDWHLELFGTMVPSPKLVSLGNRLTLIPPEQDYDEFLKVLRSRNWSIGICPLIHNRFNSLKANNKWIEYSCCNIATIASNIEPYKYASIDQCLLHCDSSEEWKHSFRQLINSPSMIDNLISKSQDFISKNYSDSSLSRQVFDLINGLMN